MFIRQFYKILFALFLLAFKNTDAAELCQSLYENQTETETLTLDSNTYRGLLSRKIQIRDYTFENLNDLGETPESFKEEIDKTNGFIATFLYPFLGEPSHRSLWSEFKDKTEIKKDPIYKKFPFLRSLPTAIPGLDRQEQKVFLAHQMFRQFLFFLKNEKEPLIKIEDEFKKIVESLDPQTLPSPQFEFLNTTEFQALLSKYHLSEHRWMITEENQKGNFIIYVSKELLVANNSNAIDEITYLMGLIGHEYGHIVGFKDDTYRTLDRLALAFSIGMRENTSTKSIQLPNNREVYLYTIRTSSLKYDTPSPFIEFGGRIILDDGENLHDLSPILNHMIATPLVYEYEKVLIPKFWGLKSLNLSTAINEKTNLIELIINVECEIKFKHLFGIKDQSTTNKLDVSVNGPDDRLDESHPKTVRFRVDLSKDKEVKTPLKIEAVDGLPTNLIKNKHREEQNPFGPSINPMAFPIQVKPRFSEVSATAGSHFYLEFYFVIPKDQTSILDDLMKRKTVLIPTLTTHTGKIFEQSRQSGLFPAQMQSAGNGFIQPDGSLILPVRFEYLTDKFMKSKKFTVDKVVVEQNHKAIGYFMINKNNGDLKNTIQIKGMHDDLIPKYSLYKTQSNESITIEIESPFEIETIAADMTLDYKDEFNHQFHQPFKVLIYKDGRSRPNSDEMNIEFLENSPRRMVIKFSRNPHYKSDVLWLKNFKFNTLHVIIPNNEILNIPVDLNLLPKVND